MADHNTNNDDEDTSKRASHFNQQRSSLRSDRSSFPSTRSRSRPQSQRHLNDFDLSPDRADASSPAPNVPYTRSRASSNAKGKSRARPYSSRRPAPDPEDAQKLEELLAPETWANPYQLLAHGHGQTESSTTVPLADLKSEKKRGVRNIAAGSQLDITALPSITSSNGDGMHTYVRSKPTPAAQRKARYATELYTISYLIFFAIWGTLARLGLQALTFYPGAPVTFSELWANVAGTFIFGFLAEDKSLFAAEWGERDPETTYDKKRHGKVKKTIPLYIGLATGFCGSFTSFSSFIRDVFLSLANELKAPEYHPSPSPSSLTATAPRNNAYSILAVPATILTTLSLCYCALKTGSHLAILLNPITPTLPFRLTRRFLDPLFVLLGPGCWLAAILLSILPPQNAWRSQALFACVFAPLGCLLRFYISKLLNPLLPTFPLGTFAVNIFGTAVLGMSYDLQRVSLAHTGVVGGTLVGCQVLQGVQDGFCGALTTVSTWIAELDGLKRRHAYVYGAASVGVGLGLAVAIMGGVRWTVGWADIICTT
ncbi:hypothetical protein HBI47_157220 [Parastagonospora nodorum]|nr:hypothetical protein HBI47_157220 [Parastagonospora nodorum]